jgi:rubrerythrin
MNAAQNRKNILQLMAENEEAVARLYRAYAERFPRHRDFWQELANEEIHHLQLLQRLPARKDPSVEINEDRFDRDVFQVSSEYLEKKLTQAVTGKISIKDALSTALDIETGMLERGYFEVFEGDSREFKRTLQALAAATEKHTNKIRKELDKKRWVFF